MRALFGETLNECPVRCQLQKLERNRVAETQKLGHLMGGGVFAGEVSLIRGYNLATQEDGDDNDELNFPCPGGSGSGPRTGQLRQAYRHDPLVSRSYLEQDRGIMESVSRAGFLAKCADVRTETVLMRDR